MFSNPFSKTESSFAKEPATDLAQVALSIIPASIRKSVAVVVGVGMLANATQSASAAGAPSLSSLSAEHRRIVDTYNTNLPARLRPFIEQYEALIRAEVVPSLVDAKKSAVKAGDIKGAEQIDKSEKAWLALADTYRGNKTQVAWSEVSTSQLPTPIQAKVDALRGQYDQSEDSFNSLYEQAVGRLVAAAQQAGDLEGVKAAQALLGFKKESVGGAVSDKLPAQEIPVVSLSPAAQGSVSTSSLSGKDVSYTAEQLSKMEIFAEKAWRVKGTGDVYFFHSDGRLSRFVGNGIQKLDWKFDSKGIVRHGTKGFRFIAADEAEILYDNGQTAPLLPDGRGNPDALSAEAR